MRTRAAVTWEKGGQFVVEHVELDDPRPDEILIKVHAAGICHTDLIARDLYYPMPLPIVLGHEGAGVVERVGDRVTKVHPGDHVVLSYRSCGRCGSCLASLPGYCDHIVELTYQGTREDGSTALRHNGTKVHSHFFGQSSFADHALATERNTVKIDPDVPFEVAAPLGCGVQAGIGAVLRSLRPPADSSMVVAGTGSVGLSAIMAAALTGCHPIVAVDRAAARRDLAIELGATHAIDPSEIDLVARVREITGGGADYALDTTGSPNLIHDLVDALAGRGTCGLLAGTPAGTKLHADMNQILFGGKHIRGIIGGDAVPDLMIPTVIRLWRAGKLPLERLITPFPLTDINHAVSETQRGTVLKAILRPGQTG